MSYLLEDMEKWAAEQEKTAAPMFGKKRYIPRTPRDDFERARSRLVMVDGMAKDKFPGYDPSRDLPQHSILKEEFEKARKSKEDYDKKESFKSFFELVEKDLEFSVDKKTTVDKSMSYSKEKWADMFYIYDYFQFYFSENDKINNHINLVN